MALIGTIRKNSWLLVVMIALGLGGFIIMDVSGPGGLGGTNQLIVGEVDGEDIDWIEFQRAEEALYQNSNIDVYSRRDYLWTYFVEDAIVKEEARLNGLSVGDVEMQELQFGTNLSPVVRRNFTDPATNQLDRQSLDQFRQGIQDGSLPQQYVRVWEFQSEEIVKDRLQSKLLGIVKKGLYAPTWRANQYQDENRRTMDFRYVMVPFDHVEDSEIDVDDDDYEEYIEEHRAMYLREEQTRDARYVVFDVLPTPQDSMILLEKIHNLMVPFAESEEDSIFALNNYGTYATTYVKQEELPEVIADTVFSMPIDSVYGPYIHDGAYQAVKVIDRKIIPDSVRARHILISIQTQEEVAAGMASADSIQNLLETGAEPFDSLAMAVSDDPGSGAQGGDLGFVAIGAFVKPMNDLLFYRDTEPGKIYRVLTQFGVHLVEVLEKKYETNEEGARLAYITETIVPSDDTQDALYDDALEFAGFNRTLEVLRKSVDENDQLTLETAEDIRENDYRVGELDAGSTSRDIVRWLFDRDTKVGRVAPEIFTFEDPVNYYNSQYVIVALEEINRVGVADPDDIMDLIEGPVKNQKKGQVILSRISGNSLSALADQFGVEIDSVENVNFHTQFMRTIGSEPKVLATAYALDAGSVSEPVIGENGVFVIEVTRNTPPAVPQNFADVRKQATSKIRNAVDFEMMRALRHNADIEDQRSRYY